MESESCTGTVVHSLEAAGACVRPPGVTAAFLHPLADGTEVELPGLIGTVVHPPGEGTEVDSPLAEVANRMRWTGG